MDDVRVSVRGLKEFQAALRRTDTALPRALRVVNLSSAQLVVEEAKAAANTQGGVAAKSAQALSARAQQRNASVLLDGQKYPYALGAEFGGGGRPHTRQFKPWRGNSTGAGYFLYPSIRGARDRIITAYGLALERLSSEAFPD